MRNEIKLYMPEFLSQISSKSIKFFFHLNKVNITKYGMLAVHKSKLYAGSFGAKGVVGWCNGAG